MKIVKTFNNFITEELNILRGPNDDETYQELNKMSGLKNATYEEIYDRISLITQNGKKIFTEEQFVEKLQEYFR